jgi:hypothetical protein
MRFDFATEFAHTNFAIFNQGDDTVRAKTTLVHGWDGVIAHIEQEYTRSDPEFFQGYLDVCMQQVVNTVRWIWGGNGRPMPLITEVQVPIPGKKDFCALQIIRIEENDLTALLGRAMYPRGKSATAAAVEEAALGRPTDDYITIAAHQAARDIFGGEGSPHEQRARQIIEERFRPIVQALRKKPSDDHLLEFLLGHLFGHLSRPKTVRSPDGEDSQ